MAAAVLLSTDAGATWSDLTQDGDPTQAEFTHPDQHAIVTLPGKPFPYWEGSDGGIVRSDGKFSDVSAKCDTRGLTAADTAFCKSLLWRVANQLVNKINRASRPCSSRACRSARSGRRTSSRAARRTTAPGKTGRRTSVWPQIIYGDGGQSGFSSANEALRFNTFTGQANDANFRDGDPTKWVIISAPILSSPEASFFYPPIIADPHPAWRHDLPGVVLSVWRTQDWGGNQAYLEANCPEFTTSAVSPAAATSSESVARPRRT